MKQRIVYVDAAKGILIVLMVAAHIFQNSFFFDFAYSFHMMAFFFISGMMLNYSSAIRKPYWQLVQSKLRTMLIPLCFFELLGILRDLIRFGFSQNLKGFLYNTVSLRFNNGVLWFLFVLLVGELLCIPLLRFLRKRIWIAAAAAFMLVFSFFLPEDPYVLIVLRNILRGSFFLCIGYLAEPWCDHDRFPTTVICAAVLILTTALGLNTSIMVRGFRMLPLFVLEALCGTELVLQLGRLPLFRFLCPVGENSLVIYGTHSLFYVIIGHWLSFDFTAISLGNGLLVLFFVALVEVPTVLFINRFLPFLAGKRYPHKKSDIHSTS